MADSRFRPGDRVMAPWEADWLYPGKVRSLDARGAFIEFDDGDMATVPSHELRSVELAVGARVQARWNRGPKQYRPATIAGVRGEELDLRYDDGREEVTTLSFVRLPSYRPWAEGDRVLAPREPEWFYPGRIRCVDDETIFVKSDDGAKSLVPASLLLPLRIREGDRVAALRGGASDGFEPADVIGVRGDEVQLRYGDGESEWLPLRFVRVRYVPS